MFGSAEESFLIRSRRSPSPPAEQQSLQAAHQLPGNRIALFACTYDLPVETPAQVVAQDDAGNEAPANFPHQMIAKKFRNCDIQIDDKFLHAVVPAILANTPEIADQVDLLENYLEVNGKLRETNRAHLVELARETAPTMLWEGPFLQLASSAVASQFADFGAYYYLPRISFLKTPQKPSERFRHQ